jgi:hypothetical protein
LNGFNPFIAAFSISTCMPLLASCARDRQARRSFVWETDEDVEVVSDSGLPLRPGQTAIASFIQSASRTTVDGAKPAPRCRWRRRD